MNLVSFDGFHFVEGGVTAAKGLFGRRDPLRDPEK